MKNEDRILGILGGIDRPGMDKVLEYLQQSNYFTTTCNHHHKERGGLAQHSLEVYDRMMAGNVAGIAADSIAIAALFHDLGKTVRGNRAYRGGHDKRSLQILDRLGLELTGAERLAVTNHQRSLSRIVCPLYLLTVAADCMSTRAWKHAHPEQCHHKSL